MKYLISLLMSIAFLKPAFCQMASISDTAIEAKVVSSKAITGSFEMNYLRHYIWRGIAFGNDDVAQPALELDYKNFALILSQNFNYKPKNVPKEFYSKNAFFDEQDVQIKYSKQWKKWSTEFSAFAYFYFYQPQSPNTAELYNWTGYNFYKDFSFFTENSLDIANYAGAMFSNNGILYEHSFAHNFKTSCTAYVGIANSKFNETYFATNKSGINLVGTHLEITKELGKYYIKLIGEKNAYTLPAIKETTELKGTDNFGIAAGINF
jgi:hypothetical protein